jgi:hypothetical protein
MISRKSSAVTSKISEAAAALLSAQAVRAKADALFAEAQADRLTHWRLDLAALPACADRVAAIIRQRYPTLDVPFHARWRHFVFSGRDLWAAARDGAAFADTHARARAEFDLRLA